MMSNDIFRKEYIEINENDLLEIKQFKEGAENLYNLIELKKSREFSIAKTKLEECVMWFTKGIASK
jgi:hypothetical protein